jgi:hypothetical protein
MSPGYRIDEQAIKSIIANNTECVQPLDKLEINIFYKNSKPSHLLMKNSPVLPPLKLTNIVYSYKCSIGDCELQPPCKYIGLTTTTLSRRLTMHLKDGGPLKHTQDNHKTERPNGLLREDLVQNTRILHHITNFQRLQIIEALEIKNQNPAINHQVTGTARILQIFGNS